MLDGEQFGIGDAGGREKRAYLRELVPELVVVEILDFSESRFLRVGRGFEPLRDVLEGGGSDRHFGCGWMRRGGRIGVIRFREV